MTESQLSPATLKADRDRFLKLAFCRSDLLFEVSSTGRIVFAAGATAPLFGAIEERLIGTSFFDLIMDDDRRTIETLFAEVEGNGRINDISLALKALGQRGFPALLAGYRALDYGDGFFLALKLVEGKSAPASDPPALPDEETFSKVAAQRIAQQTAAGKPAKVSLIRLSKFKELAEKLGSSERNGLIASIAKVLRRYSIGGDTAGQIDAESFGFVHEAAIDPETVNQAIEEEAAKHLPPGTSLDVRSATLSADDAGLSEDQVARALVHSMHEFCTDNAKLTVRTLTEAMDDLISGTMDSAKYIKGVAQHGDFDLVYMPICDLRLGKVHHFEALSRFRDDAKARSTFQIITLAEKLGLILDFDFAVVEKAISQIGDFCKRKPIPSVAINLSGLSLGNEAFVDRLHKRLDKTPGLERRIMFEVTESAEIKDLPRINTIIQSLRDKGYKFSLDDFGAGSAGFDYLNALEIDVVKFDGPVVRRACGSKRGNDLLSTMAKMCTNAGIHTVAEMVEDKKMANQVFYCGIDYGQGWYFGKPSANPFDFATSFVGVD